MVELRDVWKDETVDVAASGEPIPGGAALEDAVRALESLGLDPAEARKRVDRHLRDDPDTGHPHPRSQSPAQLKAPCAFSHSLAQPANDSPTCRYRRAQGSSLRTCWGDGAAKPWRTTRATAREDGRGTAPTPGACAGSAACHLR